MENYFPTLKKCPLFANINDAELRPLLACLASVQRSYKKNTFVFAAGEEVRSVGVVLSGSVHVLQEDYWGGRSILARVETGGLFGEAFSCAQTQHLPVSVIAAAKSEVLLVDYKRIVGTCSSACAFHTTLIKNMMKLLAEKNILLTQKMEIITHRTTRERILAYLSEQAVAAQSNRFTIPFNRQQLADYLSVDRSAMSAELSRMQADGLLCTTRSEFELLV